MNKEEFEDLRSALAHAIERRTPSITSLEIMGLSRRIEDPDLREELAPVFKVMANPESAFDGTGIGNREVLETMSVGYFLQKLYLTTGFIGNADDRKTIDIFRALHADGYVPFLAPLPLSEELSAHCREAEIENKRRSFRIVDEDPSEHDGLDMS